MRKVLGTATKLISRELELLGVQLPSQVPAVPLGQMSQPRSTNRSLHHMTRDYHSLPSVPDLPSFDQYQDSVLLDHFYLNGQAEDPMSYNLFNMPPEVYEAFSQIEPLSVIMDPGFDIY